MASVKGVNRSATIALAPEDPYIAAGTMAGAVDLSFSSSAALEIFELDFQSDDKELPIVGDSQCSERFNRLSWGKNGSGSENFALGLVAGGLVDGSIDIWNPLSLIRPQSGENPIVGHLSRHKGPVRGLEFNGIAPNLLASGADDGEICIWDLANPEQPSRFPPLKGSGSADQGEISFLSWNSKVQHILGSTSYNGTTVVWDLKRQKPVISFSDSSKRRCSVLQWNPDIATQLVVASDDDSSPSLRLWDMRNTMSPVKEFVGHTRGVIAMSWCPIDSSFLLTCSKDNRTICWDTISGEIVRELPAGNNWNFDVHWYPRIPGIISASSFDGKIGIYNIEGCCRNGNGESDFSGASLKAPKWYKRPAGVSFGFGGKLVSFHPTSSAAGSSVSASEVHVHTLVTEQSLVGRSSEFESTIQNGDRSFLRLLCEKKSKESEMEDDRETWGFLKVMFEDDGTARTKLLTHLGFNMPADNKDVVQGDLSKETNGLLPDEPVVDKTGYEGDNEATTFPFDNGEDFFNNLPSPKAETPVSISGDKLARGDSVPGDEQQEIEHTEEETADSSFYDDVQQALVVGDYKGAVAMCMSENKMADALVIAHVGGASLWENTQDQYLKMSGLPYLKIVYAMVNNDLLSLVHTRPLKFWKETLALLCSFAQREEWSMLCDALASRLMSAGNTLAAILCYICSGNIDKTVEIWSRSLSAKPEGKSYVDLLQDLMEKTIVLALATGQKRFSPSLWKLIEKYAEILASQGLLTTALEYLRLLGSDELSPELVVLRDRISLAIESEKEVKSVDFGNYKLINGDAAATEVSTHCYKEQVAPLHQQHNPRIPYGENYPLQSHGDRGYSVPSPYQPAPQPHFFMPSQAQQASKENFTSPGALVEPALRPFSPATLPPLRNAEKYRQPTTLASQLYPENALSSKMDSVPGNKIPHVAPTPPLRGFMPVPNPGVGPRPTIGAIQPPSPTQPPTIQPALTSAPPPTIQTADTSNVPVHQKPVVITLTKLFNEISEALGGARANPGKKREIEDNSRKIGALFAKLNSLDISKNAVDKLVQLCQALDNGDYSTALQIQVLLTTSEWEECSFWLGPLKRMIKTRQSIR